VNLTVSIDGLRTRNQLNTRRHWRVDQAERAAVREAVGYALLGANWRALAKPSETAPWSVTLTRLGPREMDDDGVVSALKSVRDAFAAFVGVDDRLRRVVRYHYGQEFPKPFGVRIDVVLQSPDP